MKGYLVVLVTVPNKIEAEKMAHVLVEKKLAACVNIIPRISSIYHWRGKIEEAEESMLVVKTKQSLWENLAKEVKKNHSYQIPEIIALPITKGFKPYLDWITQSLS